MKVRIHLIVVVMCVREVWSFWDVGTTTIDPATWRWDQATIRNCRFRWQRIESKTLKMFFGYWDWGEIWRRRSLFAVAGLSIDLINLTTAGILNHRVVLSAANPLDPYMARQRDLRIWALGYNGGNDQPWRYRVWRVTRVFPKSLNPEHCHGPLCQHSPRHDVTTVHSMDLMFVHIDYDSPYLHLAIKMFFPMKHITLIDDWLWFAGSGYEYLQHVYENYKIFYTRTYPKNIRDCSMFLPKWWGKFICMLETENLAGVQNGGPFVNYDMVAGMGAFEIHYNDDKIITFTDMRYYVDPLFPLCIVYGGEYYEYAYPHWSVYRPGGLYKERAEPQIPWLSIKVDKEIVIRLWPLG